MEVIVHDDTHRQCTNSKSRQCQRSRHVLRPRCMRLRLCNRNCRRLLLPPRPAVMLPDSLSVELAACALAFVYACWSQRAQGWADSSLIEVRDSAVHGKGVFARASIATGTVLGAYPGRARTPQQVLQKAQHAPATTGFVFQNSHGLYLDPTDAAGRVSSRPGPGLPWLDVDPSLAYVNEPRPGSSVNVSILDEGPAREVRFVAAQDISPGEELFIDYGQQYDRSGYLPQP